MNILFIVRSYNEDKSRNGEVEMKDNSYLPDGRRFSFWEVDDNSDRVLHVNQSHPDASDTNDGSEQHPLLTISQAAQIAAPGTKVLVYPGVYRETVAPRVGGESPQRMIRYEAVGAGKVVVSGSVVAREITPSTGWRRLGSAAIWTVRLDPDEFRGYNPFCINNMIHNREFLDLTRQNRVGFLNRRGMVFIDGKALRQVEQYRHMEDAPGTYWVEANGMTVHFRPCEAIDPRECMVELTAREQNFAPQVPHLGYIGVKGFTFTHAATGHPTPQRGSVSTYRGHHWIIEDNVIEWSNSVGIDIGNEDSIAEVRGGVEPNHTILRRNDIQNCGVCGIAGIAVSDMLLEDNRVTGCGWLMTWQCSESGGIKFHFAKNCLIRRNIVEKLHCGDAIWLDVANDNNRISQNLVLNNDSPDPRIIHVECTRDYPNLVDNNIIWDCRSTTPAAAFDPFNDREEQSMTGAIMGLGTDRLWALHNLVGKCTVGFNLNAVAFRMCNGRGGTARNARVYNNIFYDCRDAAIRYESPENESDGNLFARMPNGYLRIHYPLPMKLLNLNAWQEFYGFDTCGAEAKFDITVDVENYRMTFIPTLAEKQTVYSRHPVKPALQPIAESPESIQAVKGDAMVCTDYFGNIRSEVCLPGPFSELQEGVSINIDPRRL